jgi:hypothetical protein
MKKNNFRINKDAMSVNTGSCWNAPPGPASRFPEISSQVAWFNDNPKDKRRITPIVRLLGLRRSK